MPERDAHAGLQFLNPKRLTDIIIGSQVKGTHFVAFPLIARKDNDGNAGAHAYLLADLQAEAFRSIKTQQQEIGPIECTWYGVFTMSS
jgi:hypothetical protein